MNILIAEKQLKKISVYPEKQLKIKSKNKNKNYKIIKTLQLSHVKFYIDSDPIDMLSAETGCHGSGSIGH